LSGLDAFSAVIEGLYRSALDARAWPAAMDRLVRYVDGSATVYLSSDRRTGFLLRSEVTGLDPLANQLYLEHFADKEVRIPGTLRAGVGDVVTEQEMVDPQSFRRSEIYNELLMPFDIPFVMTVCTQRTAVESSNFVVERFFRQGPFEREQVDRLRSLVPHLRLALQLREVCDDVSSSTRAMSSWLDEQGYALISLDARGRVLELSSVARALVRQNRFISVSQGRLRSQNATETAALAAAIRRATRAAAGSFASGVRVLLTAGPATATADVLTIRDYDLAADERAVAMVILRSLTMIAPAASAIEESLGVSPAEARLARELFERGQLDEAARALNVSIHTARTQLRSVFAKTGCRNQAELIRRIASLATGFTGEPGVQCRARNPRQPRSP
jgi:DNA-binding CsgD family transcriptional regulator